MRPTSDTTAEIAIQADGYSQLGSATYAWMGWGEPWCGVSAKLRRAHRHYWDLHREVWAGLNETSLALHIEPAPELGSDWYFASLPVPGVSPELPLILGDFLNNLRSAVDHSLTAVDAKAGRRATFPICTDKLAFDEWAVQWAANKGSLEFCDALRAEQPYQARSQGKEPEHHRLRILSRLNNTDKHRLLNFTAVAIGDPYSFDLQIASSVEVTERRWVTLPEGHHLIQDRCPFFALRIPHYTDAAVLLLQGASPFAVSVDDYQNVLEIAWGLHRGTADLCDRLRDRTHA